MARKIAVEIVGDASSLEKSYAKAARSTKGFQKNVEQTGRRGHSVFRGLAGTVGLVTGALGAAGLAGAAHAAFGEMADAQKVAAQTNAVLRSTGKAAGVSAEQVDTLANSILRKSGIDDEAVKSGENLLLTFTNVRNEVGKGNDIFNQATNVMADMSVALGQDMKSSAIQLGKALNDPIKGVTALRRVGVSFTKAQTDQIKALVKSGHTLEAQKLILRELNREFGGSAKAAGQTLPGKLNILRQTLLNLGGSIAETLTPTITKLLDRLVAWLSNTKNQQQVLNAVKSAVAAVSAVVKTLSSAFQTLSSMVGGNKNAIKVLIGAFIAFKAVQMVSAVSKITASFGLMSSSLVGPAGVVVGVAAASFALSKMIRKIPGWDKAMKGFGASIFAVAENLGLVNKQGKQFAGKTNLSQAAGTFIRRQARRLEQGGMTPDQAAARIAATHPGLARRDINVLAGVGVGGVHINTVHIHGVQNVKQMEGELQKRAKSRPTARRGAR